MLALALKDATYIAHEETLAQLERDRPFPFRIFVGGGPVPLPTVTFHMGRLGTREDVEIQQEYFLDIQANAAQAL